MVRVRVGVRVWTGGEGGSEAGAGRRGRVGASVLQGCRTHRLRLRRLRIQEIIMWLLISSTKRAGRGGEGAGLGWPRRAWSGACFGYSQTKRFISASPWLGGLGVIVMSNVRRGRRVYVWGQRACACACVRVACVRAWSVCAWCDLRDVVTSSSGMGIPARCHFSGSSSVQWWGSVRRR